MHDDDDDYVGSSGPEPWRATGDKGHDAALHHAAPSQHDPGRLPVPPLLLLRGRPVRRHTRAKGQHSRLLHQGGYRGRDIFKREEQENTFTQFSLILNISSFICFSLSFFVSKSLYPPPGKMFIIRGDTGVCHWPCICLCLFLSCAPRRPYTFSASRGTQTSVFFLCLFLYVCLSLFPFLSLSLTRFFSVSNLLLSLCPYPSSALRLCPSHVLCLCPTPDLWLCLCLCHYPPPNIFAVSAS